MSFILAFSLLCTALIESANRFRQMEKTRTALIDAYVRLGCAQGDSLLHQNKMESPIESPNTSPTSTTLPNVTASDLELTVTEVQKFIELSDTKVFNVVLIQREMTVLKNFTNCGNLLGK